MITAWTLDSTCTKQRTNGLARIGEAMAKKRDIGYDVSQDRHDHRTNRSGRKAFEEVIEDTDEEHKAWEYSLAYAEARGYVKGLLRAAALIEQYYGDVVSNPTYTLERAVGLRLAEQIRAVAETRKVVDRVKNSK